MYQSMYVLDDTIVAVASPPGSAARGIVRLSGPESLACVKPFFQGGVPLAACQPVPDGQRPGRKTLADKQPVPPGKPTAIDGSLIFPSTAPLPCQLYLWPAGHSYTGQAVVEIHTLGCRPLLDLAVRSFCEKGARLAGPGEFTLRAFLSGRIDLTQAEAVLGVIDAADPRQLDVALGQLAGGLAGPLHTLRDDLLDLLAHLEAGFDFADEDLPFIDADQLHGRLKGATETVDALARKMVSRDHRSEMVRVVLLGRPNVGKSSLFNALAQRDGALVSDLPGTTRDYLVALLDLGGVKCHLVDTAGVGTEMTQPDCQVHRAARDVTDDQSRRADVQLVCYDATSTFPQDTTTPTGRRIDIWTKTDAAERFDPPWSGLPTSSLTGKGIDALRTAIRDAVQDVGVQDTDAVAGTALRCRESLRRAADSLLRATQLSETMAGEELVAAELRLALDELGKVAGAVYTDDVLDRVFSRFCIGK